MSSMPIDTPSSSFELLPKRPTDIPNLDFVKSAERIHEAVILGFLIKGIGTDQFTLVNPENPIFNNLSLLPFNFFVGKCMEVFFRCLGVQSVSEFVLDDAPLSTDPQMDYDAYVEYLKENMKIEKNPNQVREFLDLLNSYPLEIEMKKQIILGFFSEVAHLFGNSYASLAQNLGTLSRQNQEELILLGIACDISFLRLSTKENPCRVPAFLEKSFQAKTVKTPQAISAFAQGLEPKVRLTLLVKLLNNVKQGPIENEIRRYLIQQILNQLKTLQGEVIGFKMSSRASHDMVG